MFEAVFILTTSIGTRIGRFLLQEFGGRLWKPLARTTWLPGTLGSTIVIVLSWGYFIWTGDISSVWPLFGVANQLLAVVALAVATTLVINIGRQKYVWITFLPLCFLTVTTLTAGVLNSGTTTGRWPSDPMRPPCSATSTHARRFMRSAPSSRLVEPRACVAACCADLPCCRWPSPKRSRTQRADVVMTITYETLPYRRRGLLSGAASLGPQTGPAISGTGLRAKHEEAIETRA